MLQEDRVVFVAEIHDNGRIHLPTLVTIVPPILRYRMIIRNGTLWHILPAEPTSVCPIVFTPFDGALPLRMGVEMIEMVQIVRHGNGSTMNRLQMKCSRSEIPHTVDRLQLVSSNTVPRIGALSWVVLFQIR